jgi:hypothetical protein
MGLKKTAAFVLLVIPDRAVRKPCRGGSGKMSNLTGIVDRAKISLS